MDMPFIDVKASCPITAESQPGPGGCRMWFAGEQDGPIVMVDAAIYGSAPPQAASAFGSRAVELCKETLGAETVYFKLAQATDWAW